MAGILLGTLHTLILTQPYKENTIISILTDEETEAQEGEVICPKSHRWEVARTRFKPK